MGTDTTPVLNTGDSIAPARSSRMLGYLNALTWRKRDRNFFKTLRRKEPLTSDRMLALDFGTFPLNGLDISRDQNSKTVSIQFSHQNKSIPLTKRIFSLLVTDGYVNDPEIDPATGLAKPSARIIFVNPVLSVLPKVMSALFIGLYAYTTYALAAIALPLAIIPTCVAALTTVSSMRGALLTSMIDRLFNYSIETIGHEHTHLLQRDDMETGSTGFNLMSNHFKSKTEATLKKRAPLRYKFDNMLSGNCLANFMQDVEIQARLHTIIAYEYQRHGRMPTTKQELWQALVDAGIKPPKKISEALKGISSKNSYTKRPTGAFRRSARRLTDKPTAEINAVTRAHLFTDLKEQFWEETLPYLYGHLLELYGHKNGRRDMGFTPATGIKT